MARPFLVVGAMKSGTTSLHELLARHPEVALVADKERSCLADPSTASAFAAKVSASRVAVAGEVTAGYMQLPTMDQPLLEARRLLSDDLRIVAILREPVSRAVSHWQHMTQLGRETRTVATAVLDADGDYVGFSRYHKQLAGWADLVGDERVLPLRLEDLREDPVGTADSLFEFLGVSPLPEDRVYVNANALESRVVAAGWRATVSRSRLYRGAVRPLLSPRARRAALQLAGGGAGRVRGTLSPEERQVLSDLLAADLADLQRRWPKARWA